MLHPPSSLPPTHFLPPPLSFSLSFSLSPPLSFSHFPSLILVFSLLLSSSLSFVLLLTLTLRLYQPRAGSQFPYIQHLCMWRTHQYNCKANHLIAISKLDNPQTFRVSQHLSFGRCQGMEMKNKKTEYNSTIRVLVMLQRKELL